MELTMINKKDPPRYNGKRDWRTEAVLPPRHFERYTGIPVTEFDTEKWLHANGYRTRIYYTD